MSDNITGLAITNIETLGDGTLLGDMEILSVPHHVMFYPVREEYGNQEYDGEDAGAWATFREADGADGPWREVFYRDRKYNIVITPYSK